MKKRLIAAAVLATLASPAQAESLLGIYVGGGNFDFDTEGSFRDLQDGGSDIDLNNDLNLTGDSGTHLYAGLEHDIPLVPNIKLAVTEMEDSASSRLSRNIVFDGVIFPAGIAVYSEMDLSHKDLTLYYSVLDEGLNLDLGLTARKFDGGISTQTTYFNTRVTASVDLDFTVPLFYASAQVDLPLKGLYIGGDINTAAYSGNQFYDVWARIGYVLDFGLGLEAGYRRAQLDADDIDDLEADVTIEGRYLALVFRF